MGDISDDIIDDILCAPLLDEMCDGCKILECDNCPFRWIPGIRKAGGPGPCPKCGAPTILRIGKYGEFYGCSNFPKCKGNRNAKYE